MKIILPPKQPYFIVKIICPQNNLILLQIYICAEFLRELCKIISKIRFLNNSLSYENSFDVFEFLMFQSSLEVPLNILNLVLKKVIFRKREQKALCTFFYGPRKLKFLDPLY